MPAIFDYVLVLIYSKYHGLLSFEVGADNTKSSKNKNNILEKVEGKFFFGAISLKCTPM